MPALASLSKDYPYVRWAMVYTLEAHAVDEWPITSARAEPTGRPVCIPQHRQDEDRLKAARIFADTFNVPFPVFVDGIDNCFENVFCTWPFRFYILHQGHVHWRAQPRDCSYHIEDLVTALQALGQCMSKY